MPKRPNPFGDASPLQLKTHIGTREINTLGTDRDVKMKEVYEKTKNLLFSGARKPVDDIVMDANDNCSYVPNQNINKQMCIDRSGRLLSPPVVSEEPMPQNVNDNMDIDAAIPLENNKKILDFFSVKSQRQTDHSQKVS